MKLIRGFLGRCAPAQAALHWAGGSFQPLTSEAPEGRRRHLCVWGEFGEQRPTAPGLSV